MKKSHAMYLNSKKSQINNDNSYLNETRLIIINISDMVIMTYTVNIINYVTLIIIIGKNEKDGQIRVNLGFSFYNETRNISTVKYTYYISVNFHFIMHLSFTLNETTYIHHLYFLSNQSQ